MKNSQKIFLLLMRLSLGWLYLYSGITKLLDPAWSAEGYLKGAKSFAGFYGWMLSPDVLPIVNFLNEWGMTMLGVSLILGIFVRLSSVLGVILMLLYYSALSFPYPNPNSFIVDQHIIYSAALLFLASIKAGRFWGLDRLLHSLLGGRYSRLGKILG